MLKLHFLLRVNSFKFQVKCACDARTLNMHVRLVLLILVILAKRSIFVLENPSGSLIYRHARFEQLCNKIAYVQFSELSNDEWMVLPRSTSQYVFIGRHCAQVFKISFWMGLLGSRTPKRTLIWSNDRFIKALDLGRMAKGSKKASTSRSLDQCSPYVFDLLGPLGMVNLFGPLTKVLIVIPMDAKGSKAKRMRPTRKAPVCCIPDP